MRRLSDPRRRCPPAPSAVSPPPLLCSHCRCTTVVTALCHRRRLSSACTVATPQPRLLCAIAAIHSYAVTTVHSRTIAAIHSCAVTAIHSRAAIVLAATTAPSAVPSAGSSHCSIQCVMGRDMRKGKEPMVEPPKKKKTRTLKEAERAALAARAADDQAIGREHRL
jgi:hypothetical protein